MRIISIIVITSYSIHYTKLYDNVTKKDLEDFIGFNFEEVKNNWNEKFSNPYVYNDNGRQKFFAKFGKK